MASSPFKWLFRRQSLESVPNQDTPEAFPPPQQQPSWNELEPPRVRGFEFAPSPRQSAQAPLQAHRPDWLRYASYPAVPAIPVQYAALNADDTSKIQPEHASQHDSTPPSRATSVPVGVALSEPDAQVEDPIRLANSDQLFEIDELRSSFLDVMPPVEVPAFQMVTPTKEHFDRSQAAEATYEAQHKREPRSSSPSESKIPDRPADADRSTVPTCSLNLVCYRSGGSGCKSHVIRVTKESRYENKSLYKAALVANPSLITSDKDFFMALRKSYKTNMCGFWRRTFFLKTLRGFRLLSYVQNSRPRVVPLDDFVLQEILYAYNHPSKIDTKHKWIDWVFHLRQPEKRHALEFVEGWNGTRIAILGTIPLIFSTVVGLTWSVHFTDWQTGFTIAGFILTAGTLLLALLAVVSGIEASGRASTI